MSVRATILQNLETALNAIKSDTSYALTPATVSRFEESAPVKAQWKFPLVIIVDSGPETLVAQDDTDYHFLMTVGLLGFVKTDTADQLQDKLNELITMLKQFVNSQPSLGTNVMSFTLEGIQSNIYETKTENIASTLVTTRIRYWCQAGSF
jgi:hypothetical protein